MPVAYYFFLLRWKNYISLQLCAFYFCFLFFFFCIFFEPRTAARIARQYFCVRLKSVAYFAARAVKLKAVHVARGTSGTLHCAARNQFDARCLVKRFNAIFIAHCFRFGPVSWQSLLALAYTQSGRRVGCCVLILVLVIVIIRIRRLQMK